MTNFYAGIDVGLTGGWAIIDRHGHIQLDVFTSFEEAAKEFQGKDIFTVLEHAQAWPGQGVTSMFNYGQNFGGWIATLQILRIPFVLTKPQKWQKHILGTFPKGESKIRALAYAQRRYPNLELKKKDSGKIDALLMAQYALETNSVQESK